MVKCRACYMISTSTCIPMTNKSFFSNIFAFVNYDYDHMLCRWLFLLTQNVLTTSFLSFFFRFFFKYCVVFSAMAFGALHGIVTAFIIFIIFICLHYHVPRCLLIKLIVEYNVPTSNSIVHKYNC